MANGNPEMLSARTKVLLWSIGVVLLLVIGGAFLNVFPGLVDQPYTWPIVVGLSGCLIILLMEYAKLPEGGTWKAIRRVVISLAEAFIVVSCVVFLFELPHIQAFYEEIIRDLMTKPDYVQHLTPERQRELVRTVVVQRLGSASEDSAAAEAFTDDLYRELDDGQYVLLETRALTREWIDSNRRKMKSTNRLSRDIRVTADQKDHIVSDYVGGDVLYIVTVNGNVCYKIDSPGWSERATPTQDKRYCTGKLVEEANGRRITIQVPLTRGTHREERIIRRQEEQPLLGTLVDLPYFTRSLTLTFEYPKDVALEIYGHGDFEGMLDGVSTVTSRQGDVNVFNHTLEGRWFDTGSNLRILLSLDGGRR